MASKTANGTTMSFASAYLGVVDVSMTENGNPVDLTNLSSSRHEYGVGIPDYEITITVFSIPSSVIGATGNIVITWSDGSTVDTLTSWVLTNKEKSATVDGALTSKLTFKPAAT